MVMGIIWKLQILIHFDLATAITAEMWIQLSSLVGSDVDIFLNKEDSYEFGIATIDDNELTQQNFAFALFIDGSWASANNSGWHDGGQRLELNQWYHVAITYDGKVSNAYVGGTLKASYPRVIILIHKSQHSK